MQFKEAKKVAAEDRQAFHQSLTTEQKIAKLDEKFGKGQGAEKERARLAGVRLEKKPEEKKVEPVAPVPKKRFKKGKTQQ